jgi:hypothetical protein
MKRSAVVGAMLALVTTSVWAAPDTVLEKTEALESTVYGKVQVGALTDRVHQLQDTIYGTKQQGSITGQVEALFKAVESQNAKVTLHQEVNALEWMYYDEVHSGSLVERIGEMERSVNGLESKGSLQSRVQKLKQAIFGTQVGLRTKQGTIGADQVFSLELTEPITSQKNLKDDVVHVKVAEDIMDGETLLIPRGTVGTGHITEITKARSFGRNAKLNIVFDQLQGIDGTVFTAIQGEEAKSKTKEEYKAAGASVAGAVLLGPVGLVGGFFVKGKSIDLPVGTLVYVQPESTVTISGVEVHGVDTAASVRPVEPITTPAAPAAPTVAPKAVETTAPKAVETAKEQAAQVAPNDALIEKPVIIVKREKE